MTFPATPLDIRFEFDLGGWTDITDWMFIEGGFSITRGRSDWASQVDQGKAAGILNNPLGRFSPRNPTGPYYGLLSPRNTPMRVSLPYGSTYLYLPGKAGDSATTPDSAGLSITGDIDLRADATLPSWHTFTELLSKWVSTGNQRSYLLFIGADGHLKITWSSTGGNILTRVSTVEIPASAGRLAVRATVDVDNGAAGHTVTFYTAPTIGGVWTQLGAPVVTAGTTSIFDSTAPLTVGDNTSSEIAGQTPGKVQAVKVLQGIGGTERANPDFTAQTPGTTSFADAAGNTWTLQGAAEISNRLFRFHGEVPAFPPRWDLSGRDVYVPFEAAGILRRLRQGSAPLHSTLFRALTSLAAVQPVAYWPGEDAEGARSLGSGIPGGIPMVFTTGTPTLATYEGFACSAPLPTIGSSTWKGFVQSYPNTSQTQLRFLLAVPSGGMPNNATVARLVMNGTATRWDIVYTTVNSGSLDLRAFDADGNALGGTPNGAVTGVNGHLLRVSLEQTQNGGNVDWDTWYQMLGRSDVPGNFGTITGATMGRATGVYVNPNAAALDDVAAGHIAVHSAITSIFDLLDELEAYVGERAAARFVRLCAEQGITSRLIGNPADTPPMGAQTPAKFLDLLQECVDADLGMMFEPREVFGLGYRTRASLYNQPAAFALDYESEQLAAPAEPDDGDQILRNDWTVSRKGGSFARAFLEFGPLSLQDPPSGAGQYDDSTTVNVETDEQLPDLAGWLVHLGTVDKLRWPGLSVNLASPGLVADPALAAAVVSADMGDRVTLDNNPVWLPPEQASQLIQGYTETFGSYAHDWTANCSPESPFQVAVLDDGVLGRADTDGSELAGATSSGATLLQVLTTSGPLWTTDPAEFPFDVTVAGEDMTVTNVTSAVSDAFGRSLSGSWGSPDIGPAYTLIGSAADFAVGSGFGSVTLPATGVAHLALLTAPAADVDLYGDVATSVLATGASLFGGLVARCVDNNNLYTLRVEFTTAAAILLSLRKRVGAVETQLATFTAPLTHVAATFYRTRLQVQASALRAKIWSPAAMEPPGWPISATDTDLTAAANIGTRSFSNAGNTNTNPVVRYDNIQLVNPQTFTVIRSINDVVKAQAAGADVRLTHPMILAL